MEYSYLSEFITLAVIQFVAMVSPGPDFAVFLQQSLKYGRRAAFMTAVGISTGILVHVAYTLLGIGVIIANSIVAFTILKVIGALYLIYIGIKSIKAKKQNLNIDTPEHVEGVNLFKSFKAGFLTNALNPKVTLTFLSVFSVVINPNTPLVIQTGYGLWIALSSLLWFGSLAFVFSNRNVRNYFKKFGHIIEKTTGAFLITIGIKLALMKQ